MYNKIYQRGWLFGIWIVNRYPPHKRLKEETQFLEKIETNILE